MKRTGILEVDTHGMRDQALERGLLALVLELYSNAVDELKVSLVDITLARASEMRGRYKVTVSDNSPDGFRDLAESYTLFAPSYKRDNPEQRGRFNVGEKYFIAACEWVEIVSTTGRIRFDDQGRHNGRYKRDSGTLITGEIRSNQDQVNEAVAGLMRLIVPQGVTLTVNGLQVPHRRPITTMTATLPTMFPGEDGLMHATQRQTLVSLYAPLPDTEPMLHELGVPVVALPNAAFDIDVGQKVPLNHNRDNVTPSYLAQIHAIALNAAVESGELDEEHVAETWVREGAGHKNATPEAVRRVMDLRFGTKRVGFDPSDPEANSTALLNGYTVVYPRQLSRDERANVNAAGALQPAGRVFRTPKWEYSTDPDAEVERTIPESAWTPGMQRIVAHARFLARELLGINHLAVKMVNEPVGPFGGKGAAYGDEHLLFNAGCLGFKWFDRAVSDPAVSSLLIHEFAHHFTSDHKTADYHDDVAGLGGRMVKLALEQPEAFA